MICIQYILGVFDVYYPRQFDIEQSQTLQCSVQIDGITYTAGNCNYSLSMRQVALANFITQTLYTGVNSHQITLTIQGTQNPCSERPTDSFKLDMKDSQGYLISIFNGTLSFQAQAQNLQSVQVQSTSNTTLDIATVMFGVNLDPSVRIEANSSIQIIPPMDIQIFNVSNLECVGIANLSSSLNCFFNDTTGAIVIYDEINSLNLQGPLYIEFGIKSFVMPPTTSPSGYFSLSFVTSDGFLQQQSLQTLRLQMTQGQPFRSVSIKPGSLVNGAICNYTFTIQTSNVLQGNEWLMITLPSQVKALGQLQCNSQSNYMIQQMNCQLNQSQEIQIQMAFLKGSMILQPGSSVAFTISGLQNPTSSQPTDSFSIKFLTQDMNYITMQQSSGMSIQTTVPGTLSQGNIYALNGVLGQPSTYQLSFMPSNPLTQGALIQITMPQEISFIHPPANCTALQGLSSSSQLQCTFNQIDNSFLIQTGLLANQLYPQLVILQFGTLQNPTTPVVTNSFEVKTLTSNNYLIDEQTTGLNIAQDCSYPCKSCGISPKICTTCTSDGVYKNLFNYTCVESCPYGFFSDSSNQCDQCSSECSSCQGSANSCTQCSNSSLYLYSETGKCLDQCPDGEYADVLTMQCVQCPYPCQNCLNNSYCLSCNQSLATMFLIDGQCSAQCPKNFIQSINKPNECTQCSPNCLECSNAPDQCKSCHQYSELPFLLGSKCVAQCSGAYAVESDGQTCGLVQEQIVPFPFLSLSLVTIMVLGVTKMAKKQIHFKEMAIAITQIILFANWIYLMVKVYQDQHWESTIIISYAILSQLIINTVWNYFYFKTLIKDEHYSIYLSSNKKKSLSVIITTILGSFQFFRFLLCINKNREKITPSNDIEKSQIITNDDTCEIFTNPIRVQRVIMKLSIVSLSCSFFPVMIQNVYNLFYTGPQRQVFFTDIESFAHSLLVGILIIIDLNKKRAEILRIIQDAKKTNDGNNQTITNYNNITPRSYSANKDVTDPYLGLLQSQDDLQRFEKIMQKFIQRKKVEIERSFTNSQIDEKLELNDLISKETTKKEGNNRYEGQSVTTNRSFQNLVSNHRHSGLQQSNTLYSDRIFGTSMNQNLQQNNQYMNSNSSINDSSVYESSQGLEKIPDIYKSDAKKRVADDGGDITSNLGEKLKKQKSLPKFFLPQGTNSQTKHANMLNHTMSQVFDNKENIIFYSPHQEDQNQSPTFNEFKATTKLELHFDHSDLLAHDSPLKNFNANSENIGNSYSPQNYSFAHGSDSARLRRKINEMPLQTDKMAAKFSSIQQLKSQTSRDGKEEKVVPLVNKENQTPEMFKQTEFRIDLKKVMGQDTYHIPRGGIHTCRSKEKDFGGNTQIQIEENQFENLDQIEEKSPEKEKGHQSLIDEVVIPQKQAMIGPLDWNFEEQTSNQEELKELIVTKKWSVQAGTRIMSPNQDYNSAKEFEDNVVLKDITRFNQKRTDEEEKMDTIKSIVPLSKQAIHRSSYNNTSFFPRKNQLFESINNDYSDSKRKRPQLQDLSQEHQISIDIEKRPKLTDRNPLIQRALTSHKSHRKTESLSMRNFDKRFPQTKNSNQQAHQQSLNRSESPLSQSIMEFQNRPRLNFRPQRPESAGSKSHVSDSSIHQQFSERYSNPLSDEKDRDILKKSIHYKVGKTIMSSLGESPLKYANRQGQYQKTEGDESVRGSKLRSKSNGKRDLIMKPTTLDLSHEDFVYDEINLVFNKR